MYAWGMACTATGVHPRLVRVGVRTCLGSAVLMLGYTLSYSISPLPVMLHLSGMQQSHISEVLQRVYGLF